MLDKDCDGKLTFAEYASGFGLLDTDKDGFISESRKEFGVQVASGAPFSLLDKDGDGKLSRAEFEQASSGLFSTGIFNDDVITSPEKEKSSEHYRDYYPSIVSLAGFRVLGFVGGPGVILFN